jgi:hypothetical protein
MSNLVASGLLGKTQGHARPLPHDSYLCTIATQSTATILVRRRHRSVAISCRSTTTLHRSTSPHLRNPFRCRAQDSPSPEGEGRGPLPPAPFLAGMCPVRIQLGRGRSPGRRFAAAAAVWRPGAQEDGGGDGSSRSMKSSDAVTAVLLEPPCTIVVGEISTTRSHGPPDGEYRRFNRRRNVLRRCWRVLW